MKLTKLQIALKELVEAAQVQSAIYLGEDAIELPEDWSMMPAHEVVRAVADYLKSCQ